MSEKHLQEKAKKKLKPVVDDSGVLSTIMDHYHILFETAQDAIFVADPESGTLLDVNKSAEELTGYSRGELVGQHQTFIHPPQEKRTYAKKFKSSIATKGKKFIEVEVQHKDGRRIPVEISSGGTVSVGKKEIHFGIFRDVSARKKMEEELSFKSALMDQSLDAMVCTDKNFRISFVNKAAEVLFGWKPEELVGKTPDLFNVDPRHKEIQEEVYRTISAGNNYRGIALNRKKSGEKFWCLFSVSPLMDQEGLLHGYMGSQRDVSDLVNANRALLEYKQAVESSKDIIAAVSSDFRYIFVNEAFLRYNGKKREEVVGKRVAEVFSTELFEKYFKPNLERCMRGESVSYEMEMDYPQMGRKKMQVSYYPHRNESGEISGVVAHIRDVTRQKLQKEENKRLEMQLRQLQKMEAIGTLAGGIAHDFNNILFPIIGMSELMMEETPEDSPEYESAKEIYMAAMRGSALVKQILAFSRQTEQEKLPLRLQQVLKEALKLTRSTIPANIKIEQNIQGDCGLVMADPTQVHQIIMNLVTNAYHAVEEKGGTISVGLRELELTPDPIDGEHYLAGRYAKITVSDTGPGIDPQIMDKIFDPYFTTKKKGKGTGLGLASVYGIVKDHGGHVSVHSEPGSGAVFEVYLPVSHPSAGQKQEMEPVRLYETGTERVLAVDDEEQILRLEKHMLGKLGYQVTTRSSSVDALEEFRASPDAFDIVITDMAMPNMTGDRLAKEMRSIRKDIPIIICTGFSEKLDKEKAMALGIQNFLMKPIVKSELAQVIRSALDESGRKGTARE